MRLRNLNRYGFTLIEALLGVAVLGIISIGMVTAFPIVAHLQTESQDRAIALTLAQDLLEDIRTKAELDFDNLENNNEINDPVDTKRPIPDDTRNIYQKFSCNRNIDVINFDLKQATVTIFWLQRESIQNFTLSALLTRQPEPLPGTIIGYVYDANTGIGIPNIKVRTDKGQESQTDSNGYYTFTDVPSGDRTVFALENRYYYPGSINVHVPSGDTVTADPIYLSPKELPGNVAGRVTDANTSNPVKDVEIIIDGIGSVKSNDKGYYSFDDKGEYIIPPGEYRIRTSDNVWKNGYLIWGPVEITVNSDNQTTQDIQLIPIPKGGVSGKVVDATNNNPISGARVRIRWYDQTFILDTYTDANGRYSVGVDCIPIPYFVLPDTWDYRHIMKASASGYSSAMPYEPESRVRLVENIITPNVNFRLQPLPPGPPTYYGNVEGYVTDSDTNQPIVGVRVDVGGRYNVTNGSGYYRIDNIAITDESEWEEVIGKKDGYYKYEGGVNIIRDRTVRHDFEMEPIKYGNIIGRVVSRAKGEVIKAATVSVTGYVKDSGGDIYWDTISAATDGNGYYRLDTVVPGTHEISASKEGYITKTKSDVILPSGETITVNFELSVDVGGI